MLKILTLPTLALLTSLNTIAAQAIPQPTIESGNYLTNGSYYSRSARIVEQQGDRLCIQVIDGPPNPYEGYLAITVSSISEQKGAWRLDATQQELNVKDATHFEFDRKARSPIWQLVTGPNPNRSNLMDTCLASKQKYQALYQGRYITGQFLQPTPATLKATNPKAKIALRKGAGTEFAALGYGLVGDRVTLIASERQDRGPGPVWFKVKFAGPKASGAEGWIREELIDRK
jgi:hypothetical protein